LDFHHIDPSNKIDTVAKLNTHSSMEATWEEVEKCICLCSNCHREFHYFKKEQNISIEEYLNN